jgi:hypothetical protein
MTARRLAPGLPVNRGLRCRHDIVLLVRSNSARSGRKSSFEEVMGEHFGPVMQAFDLDA